MHAQALCWKGSSYHETATCMPQSVAILRFVATEHVGYVLYRALVVYELLHVCTYLVYNTILKTRCFYGINFPIVWILLKIFRLIKVLVTFADQY